MELWTGLVGLVADPACKHFKRFGNGKGAHVNVVAWAESAEHFEQRVTEIAKNSSTALLLSWSRSNCLKRLYCAKAARMNSSRCEPQPNGNPMTWYSDLFTSGPKMMLIDVTGLLEKEPQSFRQGELLKWYPEA